MKKLTYLVSAIAASLGSAYADVSVSGSGSANYVSKATSGDKGNVHLDDCKLRFINYYC